MNVDADVAFAEPRSGTSRVLIAGVAGTGRSGFVARNLRVTIEPLQMRLAPWQITGLKESVGKPKVGKRIFSF